MDFRETLRARALREKNRWVSRAGFEARRLRRFRKFAQFAADNSVWYRRLVTERRIELATCIPEWFPVLTRAEVIANFSEFLTVPDASQHRGPFAWEPKAWRLGMAAATAPPLKSRAAFVGRAAGNFFDVRRFEVAEAVPGLNDFQPDTVTGSPSTLALLAAKQLEGDLYITPRSLTCTGEPLGQHQRLLIETVFGKCLCNVYLSAEHLCMGIQEASQTSMRLLEDDLIFEIHPRHTLVTNLLNRTLPLIRYRMDDVLDPLLSDEHAPYRAISERLARVEDSPEFLNRHGLQAQLHCSALLELTVPHVRQFQMRVRGGSFFEFAIVLDPGATKSDKRAAFENTRAQMGALLRQNEMDSVVFEIIEAAGIEPDLATGKFRLVVVPA